MPKRGSVKVLLPSFHPRATLGWGLGAVAVTLLLVGAVQLKEGAPLLDKTGFAQAVRQSVWNQALAGQSQAAHWPWEDLSISMSLVPAAKVPRLGLSAALLRPDTVPGTASARPRGAGGAYSDDTGRGDVAISDVAIGDSITFTATDGATCVYTVTGRRVVDPHLAGSEAERVDSATSPFRCGPLEGLIRDATEGETPIAPPVPADQQKL